ncbi:MAG: peptidase M56 BlaR1 [Bacillota bacterium]
MWLKSFVGRIAIIGVTLVAGLAVGMLGFGPAIATTLSNQSQEPAPVYQKNENGQTYGSALYATSIDTEPDLISAEGEDGIRGYVRSEDLNGVQPKTPEEALAQMRKADSVNKIPLYAVDGKTVIGTFKIEKGKMIEKLAEPKGN